MSIVSNLFEIATEAATGFVDLIVSATSGITKLFWVAETGFTLPGTLLIIGLGVGVAYFAFNFIRGLVRR